MSTTTVSGRFKSLARISEFVSQFAEEAGLDETATYTVLVAVDEACTNIIEHAYGGEGRGDIQCACDVKDDTLTIILRDRGDPFDPASVPEPDFNVPLQELKFRGVGLVLMQKIMDEIKFTTTPDGENILTMIKRS